MSDGICDFRFAICDLSPLQSRQARGGHDGSQFEALFVASVQFHSQARTWPFGRKIANRKSKIANP